MKVQQLSEELARVKAQLEDSEKEIKHIKKAVGEATGIIISKNFVINISLL